MADHFTDEQRAAIHRDGSVVLAAGAGSGKTRVLVERYLRHLETHDVRNLVAITFTERAAREMRRRIRAGLDDRLKNSTPSESERWQRHRRDLDHAVIDTIHGFCTKLLRRFAPVIGIDPAFTVLDALYTAPLRDEVIEQTLHALLLGTGSLTDDLHELFVLYGRPRVEDAIRTMLEEPDREAWTAFEAEPTEAIIARWQHAAASMLQEHATYLVNQSPAVVKLRNMRGLPAAGAKILREILTSLEALAVDYRTVKLDDLRAKAMVRNAGRSKLAFGDEHYEAVKAAFKVIREDICDPLDNAEAVPPHLDRCVSVAKRMTRVVLAVDAAYGTRKATANQLDFHDLLRKTYALLVNQPEACAHLRTQYRILMLDELQDTDPLQMATANLLTGEAKWAGGLFAVGDAKQSIYRFRGAEVALFAALRQEAPPEARLELTANFRSTPGILRFVNTLCGQWFPEESKLVPYKPESTSPSVEFLWAMAEESDDRAYVEELRTLEAQAIAKRIRELTSGDAPRCQRHEIAILFRALSNVQIYERALQDAGIDYYLVGGRAFFAQQEVYDLYHLLGTLENPYDSQALVAVLRSPFGGMNDAAVLALCQHDAGPWAALADDRVLAQLPHMQQSNARRLMEHLQRWRMLKDTIPIARLLQAIIDDSGYDAALLFEPLGERKLANLWKLADIARQFDTLNTSLAEFVVRLEDLLHKQPREEQAATLPEQAENVVRIMTIHQAKGLEFPVVFVPDMGRRSWQPDAGAVWWHRDWQCAMPTVPPDYTKDEVEAGEPFPDWPSKQGRRWQMLADARESRRVFYVACTRAEQLLVLSAGVPGGDTVEPVGPWMNDLARIYDLTSGKCSIAGEAVAVRVMNANAIEAVEKEPRTT